MRIQKAERTDWFRPSEDGFSFSFLFVSAEEVPV